MLTVSESTMLIFGVLFGLIGLFPDRRYEYAKGTLHVSEDFLNFILVVMLVLFVALVVTTTLTPIEFIWQYFFAATLCSGIVCIMLGSAILEGRVLKRWTRPMRDLYGLIPHRDSRYQPQPLSEIGQLFEPVATQFSLSNALICAHISQMAYQPRETVAELSNASDIPVEFIEDGNHVALVVSLKSSLILAFRGTDDLSDWLDNLRIFPAKTVWGDVHSGFLASVDTLLPRVKEALAKSRVEKKEVWVTGHSLGAAMAVLASMKLTTEEAVDVKGIYTFAQPLLASAQFRREYDEILGSKLYRFETSGDQVPNQPPPYRSPGTLIYLSRKDQVWTSPKWLRKFLDQMQRAPLGILGEHSMLEYLGVIEKAKSSEIEES